MSMAQLVKELREKTGAGILDCKKALQETNNDIDQAISWLRENGIAKAAKKDSRTAAEGLTKVITKDNKAVVLELNSETDFVAKNEQFLALIDFIANAIMDSNVTSVEEVLSLEYNGKVVESEITNATATIGEKITLRRVEVVTKTDDQVFGPYIHMGGKISVLVVANGTNVEVARDMAMQIAAMNPKYVDRTEVPAQIIDNEREILKKEVLSEGKPENIAEKMVEGRVNKFLEELCLVDQVFVKESKKKVKDVLAEANLSVESFICYQVGEGIEKEENDFAKEVMEQAKLV